MRCITPAISSPSTPGVGDNAVSEPCSSMSGPTEASGAECLTVQEIMGIVQHVFLKSDFALVEEALRKRENMLKIDVASAFRRELSQKEAENAILKARCEKACTEVPTMLAELKKRHGHLEAERRTWLEKEEAYKKKIAKLESAHDSGALLQAEGRTWQEQQENYNRMTLKLECELKSVTKELEAERRTWLQQEETYMKKVAMLEHGHNFDSRLLAERQAWQKKEETYNKRIAKLESELKSDALGHKETVGLRIQAKAELMETIEKLKYFEEVNMKLQKESEELCVLKIKHEQLMEELKEGKRNEELYEERIFELEKELKEKEKATAKFFEVTAAYVALEDEKDAADREAMEWKSKYEELKSEMSRTLKHTRSSQNQFTPLHPCQAGIVVEGQTGEKPRKNLNPMKMETVDCGLMPISEDHLIPGGQLIEISDSDGEAQDLKRRKNCTNKASAELNRF